MKFQIDAILNSKKFLTKTLFLLVIILILFPKSTYAVGVGINYQNYWYYSKFFSVGEFGCLPDNFEARSSFWMSLAKQFDLYSTKLGGLNYPAETRPISTGENIKASNGDVVGSYVEDNADHGTPPMDNIIYSTDTLAAPGTCGGFWGFQWNVISQVRGGIIDQLDYKLSSSDNSIIDCTSTKSCEVKNKNGNVAITVSFPGEGRYYMQRVYDFGRKKYKKTYSATCYLRTEEYDCSCNPGDLLLDGICESGTEIDFYRYGGDNVFQVFNYSLSPFTYYLTVQNPNEAPTVNYTSTTDISYNTAKANWIYSDKEGDIQKYYQVQVATDPSFNTIIDSKGKLGSDTSVMLENLKPGTTYYPRVQVEDSKGASSDWSNGVAFTTLSNTPPSLGELSCSGTSTGYTTGNIDWNYTGIDEPGDKLILKARWKRDIDTDWTIVNLPDNTRKGNIDIRDLVSGYTYSIEVSLNDNRNIDDRWKGCGTLKALEYPVPNVNLTLKSGEIAQNDGRLTVKSGDEVDLTWEVKDPDGTTPPVGLESCEIKTTGGDGNNLLKGNNFSGKTNAIVPVVSSDLSYTINLSCIPKEAKDKKNISENRSLDVESYPVVSCSLEGNKKSIKEGESINIIPSIDNVSGVYEWGLKRNIGDSDTFMKGKSPIPSPIKLDYTGIKFGQYKPLITVKNSNNREKEAVCGTITNFGSSNIKEVNP